MASVTYSFNLEPVVSAASQRTSAVSAESSAAVAAKFQAAQPAAVHSAPSMSGVQSPACDGSTCFIVHGEGPGVTTLSIGEEDGGAAGDFLALPVVDGVQFMEPPVTSFADAGEFDITTLAIGEEDGGVASAAPEIGGAQPHTPEIATGGQFALQPMPMAKPEMAVSSQSVQFAEVQGALGPIETTPIVEPRMKPEVPSGTFMAAAPAAATLPPVQTTPIMQPRAKPADFTFASAAPVPEMKPESTMSAAAVKAEVAESATGAAPAGGNFVSVGDYDSYIASLGGGSSAPATTDAASGSSASEAVAAVEAPATPSSVTVTYVPPPPAPSESGATETVEAPQTATTETADPVMPVDTAAPTRVEMVLQPVAPAPVAATADVAAPRMKPASFTTQGPASLPPIDTVAIETSPAPVSETIFTMPQAKPAVDSGQSFSTVDAPAPAGKPEGVAADAPRLSAEDFRITTLALGEEDAGGG